MPSFYIRRQTYSFTEIEETRGKELRGLVQKFPPIVDMDSSTTSWFSELGMEDPSFADQCDILDFFDEDLSAALGEDNFQSSFSPEWNSSSPTLIQRTSSTITLSESSAMELPQVSVERPAKQQRPNSDNSPTIHNNIPYIDQPYHSPMILTFGNSNNAQENNKSQQFIGTLNPEDDAVSEVLPSRGSYVNLQEAAKNSQTTKKTSRRPPSLTYDHIVAERKRREQLSLQFVALSAIVPGLKKMDKTSVLGDAINYLKHLQERVNTLEEQATKQTVESLVLVKKSQLLLEDDGSSDEQGCCDEQSLPQIEAKVCDNNFLLRIQCEKHKGVLIKILSVIHQLNLAVTNTSVTPFGNLALDITIIAEMGKESKMTVKELVKNLRSALKLVRYRA